MVLKLFYAPGTCSLASHICLIEGGAQFEVERVDLITKITSSGRDFRDVTAKGYVPALMLESGELVTENLAVLVYLASKMPAFGVAGEFGHIRLLETLAYVSTEIHKSFKPFFLRADAEELAKAGAAITHRLQYLADRLHDQYLFGSQPSVADFYLFVMMNWAKMFGVEVPPALLLLDKRLSARPAVQTALRNEGMAA